MPVRPGLRRTTLATEPVFGKKQSFHAYRPPVTPEEKRATAKAIENIRLARMTPEERERIGRMLKGVHR